MSTVAAASCDTKGTGEVREEKKPLRPCCACPETKKARDACKNSIMCQMNVDQTCDLLSAVWWNPHLWGQEGLCKTESKSEVLLQDVQYTKSYHMRIIEKGEENCGHLIEAHKECMRALGFKI